MSPPWPGAPDWVEQPHLPEVLRKRAETAASTALIMGSMNPCGWLEAVGPTLPHFPKWAASLLEPQVLPWQAQVAHPVSGGPSPWISRPDTDQLDGTMAPAFLLLLLLLLLWPQGCVSGKGRRGCLVEEGVGTEAGAQGLFLTLLTSNFLV